MKASFVLFVLSLACLCMQGCSSSYAKTGEEKGKNTPYLLALNTAKNLKRL